LKETNGDPVFRYDSASDKAMADLTQEDILYRINSVNISGVFLMERNFTELLSDIKYKKPKIHKHTQCLIKV